MKRSVRTAALGWIALVAMLFTATMATASAQIAPPLQGGSQCSAEGPYCGCNPELMDCGCTSIMVA